MVKNWPEHEITIEDLQRCAALFSIAAKDLQEVAKQMADEGMSRLIMKNVITLVNSSKGAASSVQRAKEAMRVALEMKALVSDVREKDATKRAKKKG